MYRNSGTRAWRIKMMATFAKRGVLTTYLELCGDEKKEKKKTDDQAADDDEGDDRVVYDHIMADLVCMMEE